MAKKVLLILTLLALAPGAGLAQNSSVILADGSLNGRPVDTGVLELRVYPDSTISGTVTIKTYNPGDPGNVAPLVMVWNWGTHSASYSTIDGWIPTDSSAYDVSVDLVAPSTPGDYYITFAWRLEMNGAQVASLTNWQVPGNPHWDDGHDIADWGAVEYSDAVAAHAVTTMYELPGGFVQLDLPAAMIKVSVGDYPAVRMTGGVLNRRSVDSAGVLEIRVHPDSAISGNLLLETFNAAAPVNVAPLVMVWGWGSHSTAFSTIHGDIAQGFQSHSVPVSLTAPGTVGTYYVSLAFALELTGAQVASLTNWQVLGNPHWDDGHDIADWGAFEYGEVLIDDRTPTQYEGPGGWHTGVLGAAMVKVKVEDFGTVKLLGGSLHGVAVSDGRLEIEVEPDSVITGSLSIQTYNPAAAINVAPFVMVWNWGDHSGSFAVIHPDIMTGVEIHNVPVSLVAPSAQDTFYITFAYALELTGAQVASLTNWQVSGNPHWNDGHDIADWGGPEYLESLIDSYVPTIYEGAGGLHAALIPAAMVRVVVEPGVDVDDEGQRPFQFALGQNCPNPFNAQTRIAYTLGEACSVRLEIYNILGQHVETLVEARQGAGEHYALWNAAGAPSGVYFYRLTAGQRVSTRAMMLLK